MNNEIYKQVLSKSNIFDVVSYYGINVGKNNTCLCPFHNDTNPSMSINIEKNIFKCFSCGEGGNPISFVYKYETMINHNSFTISDAIKKVIEICGIKDIELDFPNDITLNQYNEKQNNIIKTNLEANKLFRYSLYNTKDGHSAMKYLNDRGIDDNLIEELSLGYSPIYDVLAKNSNPLNVDAGLVNNEGIVPYDTLRGRITFPIHDDIGNIVGFSGRVFEEINNGVKYLNTKETDVFIKGNLLYNFHNARKYASEDIYLVEGYMDVVACKKLGIQNAVAIMGTALTERQTELIKKLDCKVHLMLDRDNAGRNAILKIIDKLQLNDIDLDVIDLEILDHQKKDIGEIVEMAEPFEYNDILNRLEQAKISPFMYQLISYKINKGINGRFRSVAIIDYIEKFKDYLSGMNRIEFIDYIEFNSGYTRREVEELLKPNLDDYRRFVYKAVNEKIDSFIVSEIKKRNDLLLLNYYQENKTSLLLKANQLLQDDKSLYANDDLIIVNLVNRVIRDSNEYKEFKLNRSFKQPSIFENPFIFVENENKRELKKIKLDQLNQNKIIIKLNNLIADNENIQELYIINDINDVFDCLPIKLISPSILNEIKMNLYDNEPIIFNFNSIFDSNTINKNLLDLFDNTYKSQNGQLKTIVLYPNFNQDIEFKTRKTISKQSSENEVKYSGKYLNVYSSLIIAKNDNGYYIKAPKQDEIAFFIDKEDIESSDSVLKVKLSNKMIKQFGIEDNKLHYSKDISCEQLTNNFKVYSKNRNTLLTIDEVDVDFIIRGDKEYALVHVPYKNGTASVSIPQKYIIKKENNKVVFKLKPEWKYTLNHNGIKVSKTSKQIKDMYECLNKESEEKWQMPKMK